MTTGEKVRAGRVTVELSNTGKVLFPEDGITKGDLVAYYQAVAGEMLPPLRDRPVSMTRFPDGISKSGIVQKNVPAYFPDWITRARVRKEGGSLRQVVCDKPATIVYLANQACIELHAFLSRLDHINEPDQLIFDLDPPDGNRFGDVRGCAMRLRELLTGELGLPAFVKTTGGKGLHVHVPLNARQDFGTVREFARQAAELLAARNPDLVTHPSSARTNAARASTPTSCATALSPSSPSRAYSVRCPAAAHRWQPQAELGRAGRRGAGAGGSRCAPCRSGPHRAGAVPEDGITKRDLVAYYQAGPTRCWPTLAMTGRP